MLNIIQTIAQLLHRAYILLSGKLVHWYDIFISTLPNLIVAVLVVMVMGRVAKSVRSLVFRYSFRLIENKAVIRVFGMGLFYLVHTTGFFTALSILHLEKTVTSLLAGAGVVGLAIGFAFQDLASNFISGLFIAFQKPFKIGDFIETNSYSGHIDEINLRTVEIVTLDDQHVIIPSKDIFQSALVNYNLSSFRRVNLKIGVSYKEDLEKVQKIVCDTVQSLPFAHKERPITVHFYEFGESSINFDLRFWIKNTNQNAFFEARSEAIIAIKKAFDAQAILIPFPVRTLEFDTKKLESIRNF